MRRWTPALAGVILALLALPAMATADTGQGTSSGSDRGHAARADWSAGPVARGTGYARAGGSRRVREVQRRLRSLGYHPGPVDGLYGPRTERAAGRFQEARRLRADAVVGPRTLLAIRTRDDARRPAAAPPPAPAPLPAAVATPAPRSAAPATAPQPSPFPFATVLAIRGVLGIGVAAVAGAGCGREAVELARYHRPDVLITDATHPDIEADELCRRLALEAPGTAVVVLCAVEDPELAVRCLRAGAVGYLTKDTEPERLPTVVRGVAEGEAAISRRLTLRLIESLPDVPDTGWRPVRSRLTSREWEVVDLLGEGASTDAIAEHLVLSPATVYSPVKNVHAKLGVHSRHDAVAAAMALRREEATCAA